MSRGYQYRRPGTRKNEILRAILVNGFVPFECLNMFSFSKNKAYQVAKELAKEGLVTKETTPNHKHILTIADFKKNLDKYKDGIPDGYAERYEYLSSKNRWEVLKVRKIKAKNGRMVVGDIVQKRLFRQVITSMFFHWCQIPAYMDERPPIFAKLSDLAYYPSNELKEGIGYSSDIDEKTNAVSGTRMTGLLHSPGGNFGVFCLNDSLIELSKNGEFAINAKVSDFLRNSGDKRLFNEAIVYYKNDDVLRKLYQFAVEGDRSCDITQMSNIYRNIYLIPLDEHGKRLTRAVSSYAWKRDLITKYVDDKFLTSTSTKMPCDGFDKENQRYILVWCIPDILKLVGFLIRSVDLTNFNYTIHCYDWQEEFIRSVATNCEIVVHKEDE